MTPLAEQAALYAAERALPNTGERALLARAFMAGVLAAAMSPASRDQLKAECLQFGRAIGSAAERAQA
jgi:hypothetical protein